MTLSRTWVILTMGDRPAAVEHAVQSVARCDPSSAILLVCNGGPVHDGDLPDNVDVVTTESNLGVPGGRDFAIRRCQTEVVAFLDDDAVIQTESAGELLDRGWPDDRIGALTFRLRDERGETARRHNPRVGHRGSEEAGSVATFLGGASAIRRDAYLAVGGYWPELFYAHEELDLSWRLADAGLTVNYLPTIEVFHPRSEITRHASGWRLTGRNRVLVARRNLPIPVLLAHTLSWLVVGTWRCPNRECRRAYLGGWLDGWRQSDVPRRPMSWRTVLALGRLGRPPLI